MAYETFEKVEGLIRNIDRSDDCCSMILALSGDGEVTNVVVSGDTAVIDHVRLRRGCALPRSMTRTCPRRQCIRPSTGRSLWCLCEEASR